MLPRCGVEYNPHSWCCLACPKGCCRNSLLFGQFKGSLQLRVPVERVVLSGHSIEKTHKLTARGNIHSPETRNAQESLCFFFASWWGCGCYLIEHILWDVTTPILPFYSPKLDLLCRSFDLALFYGKTSSQKEEDFCLSALEIIVSFWYNKGILLSDDLPFQQDYTSL